MRIIILAPSALLLVTSVAEGTSHHILKPGGVQDKVVQTEAKRGDEVTVIIIEPEIVQDLPPGATPRVAARQLTKVPTDKLAEEFQAFVEGMASAFQLPATSFGDYVIDEIELRAAITAEGGFSLIGRVSAGATGGIAIRFKRQTTSSE